MSRWLWIGGLGLVILPVLLVWGVMAGVGLVTNRLPQWLAGGKHIAAQSVREAEEVLPGLKERVKALVPPGLGSEIEDWVPGAALPGQDVGGEDIAGIPRFRGMARVAFGVHEQKKSVAYIGEAAFAEVIAFYARQMAARGFTGQVTSASPTEETHVYASGNRRLAFKFVKTSRLGTEMTEVEAREL